MFRIKNIAPIGRGGSALVGSAREQAGGPQLPPHLYPPRGARMIFKSDTMATTGAGLYAPAGLAFTLPKGIVGILRTLSLFVDSPTSTTGLTWNVRVNGVCPPGLSTLTVIPRTAASIEKIFDQWSIELPEQCSVDVQIQQTDAGLYRVGMQLEGWQYTSEQA